MFVCGNESAMRQSGRRLLLGHNTVGRAVMLQLIRFQWVGCLDLNWTALQIQVAVYIYNIYTSSQSQPTLFVIENLYRYRY